MCTCCQNWMNTTNTVNTINGCGTYRCGNGCGNRTQLLNGCYGCTANARRYITFPISGRAVVPVSAICFYPTSWGNTNGCCGWGTTANTNTTTTNGNGNCCGFGRCGSAAAIANFNEDYYARQYGLND